VAGQGTTNGCELGPDYHSSTGVTITFPAGCSNNVLNGNWPDANVTMVDADKTNEKRIGLVRATAARRWHLPLPERRRRGKPLAT